MRDRTRSLRGFLPGAVAGGVLALGWVALSIAFGSGSAQAAETVPPSPPSLLGTLQSTVGAVQSTIAETPATVQSTLSAVRATVAEVLPAPAAVEAPTPAPAEEPAAGAPAAPTNPLAPASEELADPLAAPLVGAIAPIVHDVGQSADAAIDVVTNTTDTVAPALSPVFAPVDALLRHVPATLDTVTAALPRIADALDDTVGAVTETVRGATAVVVLPPTTAPGGHPAAPELHGMPDPVSAASPPTAAPASARDDAQRPLPVFDDAVGAAVLAAPAAVTAPGAPAQQPSSSPAAEFGMPGTGSASGGSAGDVRLFGTVSSTSAGAGLLAVRSGSAGDDRLPASPVADHDSSPD